MIENIILFINGIETQGYFSMQLGKAFQKMGKQVFYYDYWEEERSFRELQKFICPGKTVMVTFNFHGLEEGERFYGTDGSIFWEKRDIPCLNIVLDHPMYYHKMLKKLPSKYVQISIDRYHRKYMEKYWSNIKLGPFLPLAGTRLGREELLPVSRRPIDIIITGNYTPPETFRKYIDRLGAEYTEFYMEMIEDLLLHEDRTIEQVAEAHIRREIPEVTQEELREAIGNLTFIDLYVRFMLRGRVIKQLVDDGLKVHTCGKGWNLLECRQPQNIIEHDSMISEECLKMLQLSKISINVMPWFKDGAHDRIYNSLLNGAACVSDGSNYLRENFTDGKDICFFRQNEVEQISEIVKGLLEDEGKLCSIAEHGYENAANGHTWEDYALKLMAYMKEEWE